MLAELHRERCSRSGRTGVLELPDIKLVYKERPGVALGSILWSGGGYLCRYLVENPTEVANMAVLELGCGIGICSILCSKLGAKVTCTDKDDVLEIVRENAESNAERMNIQEYLWGQESIGVFEVIIGSDIVYYDQNTENLILALLANSRNGSKLILAYTVRHHSEQSFFKSLEINWAKSTEISYDAYKILIYIRIC